MARLNVEVDADKIREQIKISGYNMKELSKKLDISDSYISSMLSYGTMNGRVLRQLAAILNVNVEEFLRHENKAPSAPVSFPAYEKDDSRTNNLLAALYKRVCSLENEVKALNEKVGNLNFVEPTEEQMLKFVVDKLSTPKRGKIA